MRAIWKYPLELRSKPQNIQIPKGGTICFIGRDPASACPAMWLEVNTEAETEDRQFLIRGTGHPLTTFEKYCGSVICDLFVWHIFEATL